MSFFKRIRRKGRSNNHQDLHFKASVPSPTLECAKDKCLTEKKETIREKSRRLSSRPGSLQRFRKEKGNGNVTRGAACSTEATRANSASLAPASDVFGKDVIKKETKARADTNGDGPQAAFCQSGNKNKRSGATTISSRAPPPPTSSKPSESQPCPSQSCSSRPIPVRPAPPPPRRPRTRPTRTPPPSEEASVMEESQGEDNCTFYISNQCPELAIYVEAELLVVESEMLSLQKVMVHLELEMKEAMNTEDCEAESESLSLDWLALNKFGSELDQRKQDLLTLSKQENRKECLNFLREDLKCLFEVKGWKKTNEHKAQERNVLDLILNLTNMA